MPRRARMYVPGFTYHITQRGNNRCACFFDESDFLKYLSLLEEVMPRYGVVLHTYVLMNNHVHFLMTPMEVDSISRTMRVVGSRYATYTNKKYARTGTLWEGRHHASAVDSERYLIACYRYIEMNPVRAMMVAQAVDYRWSSFKTNAQGLASSLITPHSVYLALANTPQHRLSYYRSLFTSAQSIEELTDIRQAAFRNTALGSPAFCARLSKVLALDELSHAECVD